MLSGLTSLIFGASESQPEASQDVDLETTTEQGWVLVDLPGGTSSSQVEMTPMENLLIEHPSMSVYQGHQPPSGSAGEENESSESSNQEVVRRKHRPNKVVTKQPPRKPHAVAARVGLLAQIENIKAPQRVEHFNSTRKLNRKNLDRMNRNMVYSSAGKTRQQKNFLKCPSGFKSGRVPQRQY